MRVDLFDFELPEQNIALRPQEPRDHARLLYVQPDQDDARILQDLRVDGLVDLLQPGDALVFNDTKVIPAQLEGVRERDGNVAQVSATLHMRVAPDRWKAFLRPAKRVKQGERICFGHKGDACNHGTLEAVVAEKSESGEALLVFDYAGAFLDEAIALVGHIPLPPYIASKRPEDERDLTDYQTVYAREKGAVAAPTAGLHFTPELLEKLKERGVEQHFVTLHVGAGTFLPVKTDDTTDHKMHSEIGYVSEATAAALNAVHARGRRVICVGTTSLRLIESASTEDGQIQPWSGATDIFITPGYKFRAVDLLMTNFHLPRSTLFMLVSAFAGMDMMHQAYKHAIENGYRFYSYGDASLLKRA